MTTRKTIAAIIAMTAMVLTIPAFGQITPIDVIGADDLIDQVTDITEILSELQGITPREIGFSNPAADFIVRDETGDGEFSTGETPSQDLPVEFDIQQFAAYLFTGDPGIHPFSVERVSEGGIFCGDPGSIPQLELISHCQDGFEGSDFNDGTYIATIGLAGPFDMFSTSQICEFVVWYDDARIEDTFTSLPQFPNDPADGTNTAFGVRSTFGEVQPFGLELTSGGFFQDMPTSTVGVFGGDEVSLLIPSNDVVEPTHMVAYTFCTGGSYSASDSFADTTMPFDPVSTQLLLTEVVPVTTSTSTTSTTSTTTTTTTTQPPTTTGPTTTSEGGFPWVAVIVGGVILTGIGIWMAARKKNCEKELLAWQAAQKVCDEATETRKKAEEAVTKAEKTRDDAEEAVEDLCEAMPPICWDSAPEDSWAEDPDVPGSRIDRFDLFVKRAWGKSNWSRYRDGKMTAQEVEQAWEQDPPGEFGDGLRKEYEASKGKKKDLDKKLEDAETELDKAEKAVEEAEGKAKEACKKAAAAKAAYDACMSKPTPTPAGPGTGGTTGGDPGPTPGPTPGTDGGDGEGDGCSPENDRKEGESETISIAVPTQFRPRIMGGAAHRAREQADEIGSTLQQAEEGAKAIGRLFSFGGSGAVVTDFSVGAAADLAVGATSEATGIPLPTNIGSAVANVSEVYLKAARVSITKVLELQERRLNDVDLAISIKFTRYKLTCTQMLKCTDGTWVKDGTRLTVEQVRTYSTGEKKFNALTWAQAQETMAGFSRRRFEIPLRKALEEMRDFQNKCKGG